MRRAPSLRLRLAATLTAVSLIGLGGMATALFADLYGPRDVIEDTSLKTQARALLQELRPGSASLTPPPRWRAAYARADAAFFTLYAADGRVLARSANLSAPLPDAPPAPGHAYSALRLEASDARLALSARAPGGRVLVVGRSVPGRLNEESPDYLEDYWPIAVFGLFAAVAAAAAIRMTEWSLRPLTRAARAAAALDPAREAPPLPLSNLPVEVAPFADALNGALDRTRRDFDMQRRFTADTAHALRTPLAVLDLRLQRAVQGREPVDLSAVRAEVQEIARRISSLLNLSRAEGAAAPAERVNAARVLREAVGALAALAEEAGRALAVEAEATAWVAVDGRRLRDLVEALLDNALIHGRGAVRATLRVRDADVELEVADEGPGVPDSFRSAAFDRFTKLDPSSPGAGLGLRRSGRSRPAAEARRSSWGPRSSASAFRSPPPRSGRNARPPPERRKLAAAGARLGRPGPRRSVEATCTRSSPD